MPSRPDLNQPGEAAIERMVEPQRSIARAADMAIRSVVPTATSIVKWGNACYYADGKGFASLVATRAGVNLMLSGASLPDPFGLLEGTGKTLRHVKLRSPDMAALPGVADLIRGSLEITVRGK